MFDRSGALAAGMELVRLKQAGAMAREALAGQYDLARQSMSNAGAANTANIQGDFGIRGHQIQADASMYGSDAAKEASMFNTRADERVGMANVGVGWGNVNARENEAILDNRIKQRQLGIMAYKNFMTDENASDTLASRESIAREKLDANDLFSAGLNGRKSAGEPTVVKSYTDPRTKKKVYVMSDGSVEKQ